MTIYAHCGTFDWRFPLHSVYCTHHYLYRPDRSRFMTSTDAHPYLAIDLGGSKTRLGLFPVLEAPDFTPLGEFSTQSAYEDQLEQISTLLRERYAGELAGVGVSVGARVARDGRSIGFGPNFLDYLDRPLAADLEARLGCPVRLGHDTVCGLLGERRFGALN